MEFMTCYLETSAQPEKGSNESELCNYVRVQLKTTSLGQTQKQQEDPGMENKGKLMRKKGKQPMKTSREFFKGLNHARQALLFAAAIVMLSMAACGKASTTADTSTTANTSLLRTPQLLLRDQPRSCSCRVRTISR